MRALVGQEQVLGELLGQRRAALDDGVGAQVLDQRAQRAGNVDAEMVVEAPVLGRQHRLDQIVGHFLQRHRVALVDAALADLVAVAVEEGDGEIALRLPVGGWSRERRECAKASISTAPPAPSVRPSPSSSTTARVMPVTRKRRMKRETASNRPAITRPARNRLSRSRHRLRSAEGRGGACGCSGTGRAPCRIL